MGRRVLVGSRAHRVPSDRGHLDHARRHRERNADDPARAHGHAAAAATALGRGAAGVDRQPPVERTSGARRGSGRGRDRRLLPLRRGGNDDRTEGDARRRARHRPGDVVGVRVPPSRTALRRRDRRRQSRTAPPTNMDGRARMQTPASSRVPSGATASTTTPTDTRSLPTRSPHWSRAYVAPASTRAQRSTSLCAGTPARPGPTPNRRTSISAVSPRRVRRGGWSRSSTSIRWTCRSMSSMPVRPDVIVTHRHAPSRRSSSTPDGVPPPDVTMAVRAPATWRAPASLRSCAIAS